jgi:hypothetical protein
MSSLPWISAFTFSMALERLLAIVSFFLAGGVLNQDPHTTWEAGTNSKFRISLDAVFINSETCYKDLAFEHEALIFWRDFFPNVNLL